MVKIEVIYQNKQRFGWSEKIVLSFHHNDRYVIITLLTITLFHAHAAQLQKLSQNHLLDRQV